MSLFCSSHDSVKAIQPEWFCVGVQGFQSNFKDCIESQDHNIYIEINLWGIALKILSEYDC